MRTLLLLALALPAAAQFRSLEIHFEGIGCASCMESLPGRLQRTRGIKSVQVDGAAGLVRIQLARENRVRLEQVRDAIEQDGTRATRAVVTVGGNLAQEEGKWVLHLPSTTAAYTIEGAQLAAGGIEAEGTVANLHPGGGTLVISAVRVTKRD